MEQQNLPQANGCAICGTYQNLLRCSKCKSVHYCSIEHQHMDWPNHKRLCKLLAGKKENNKMHHLQQAVAAAHLGSSIKEPYNQCMNGTTRSIEENLDSLLYEIPTTTSNAYSDGIFKQPGQSSLSNANRSPIDPNIILPQQWPLADLRQNLNDNPQNTSQIHQLQFLKQQEEMMKKKQQQQQQQFIFYNQQNGQNDRNLSYQIGQCNEDTIGNANERRYDELCRNIINDMNQYGLSVVDDFLGNDKGLDVLNEVHRMYSAGKFEDGQLQNSSKTDKDLRTIRGDKITWVKGLEPGCASVGYLINQIDAVICRANSMENNGKLGQYNIKERTKAMVACYPGSGTQYVMHVDNPNKDGRVITAIYYLNLNWDTKRSGGVLRIFPEQGNSYADIEPKFDRLIFFWSDKRNPHEVQPAHRTRYAITVWYFDANEREAAINRWKYENNKKSQKKSPSETTTSPSITTSSDKSLKDEVRTQDATITSSIASSQQPTEHHPSLPNVNNQTDISSPPPANLQKTNSSTLPASPSTLSSTTTPSIPSSPTTTTNSKNVSNVLTADLANVST